MNVPATDLVESPCCGICRYWRRQRDAKLTDWGECRRMPPHLPPIEEDKLIHVGLWPHTVKDDWCGEWHDANDTGSPPGAPGRPKSPFSS